MDIVAPVVVAQKDRVISEIREVGIIEISGRLDQVALGDDEGHRFIKRVSVNAQIPALKIAQQYERRQRVCGIDQIPSQLFVTVEYIPDGVKIGGIEQEDPPVDPLDERLIMLIEIN